MLADRIARKPMAQAVFTSPMGQQRASLHRRWGQVTSSHHFSLESAVPKGPCLGSSCTGQKWPSVLLAIARAGHRAPPGHKVTQEQASESGGRREHQ